MPKPSVPRQMLTQQGKGMNLVWGIDTPEPLQVLYTDFTGIWYAKGLKKAYFMPILDHKRKWIAGWAVSERRNTALALAPSRWHGAT